MKTVSLFVVTAATVAAVVFAFTREQPASPPAAPASAAAPGAAATARARDRLAPERAVDQSLLPSAELQAKLDAARALPATAARRAAIVAALAAAAEHEPAAATAFALQLGPLEGRDEALHETLGLFLSKQPSKAFAFLHERAAHVDGETGLVLAREAAAHDPALALALAERLPQPLRSSATRDAYSAWTATDARAASAAAAQIEDEHDLAAAVAGVAEVRAHDDPQATFTWGSEFEALEVRRAALEPAIAIWAEHDPLAAALAASDATRDGGRQRLLDVAVTVWAGQNAEDALAWIASTLREPAEREATASAVLLQLAETQPALATERAAAWAQTTSRGARNPLLDKVLAMFSARSAADATAWAYGRPPGAPLRDAVVAQTLERWREQDASAAATWQQAHASR